MIQVRNVEVWGFEHAIRGMRNPMNSWDKSDSYMNYLCDSDGRRVEYFRVGENDLALMRRLYKAGTEHRKYLRQIYVSMDITAPLYWWKEFDTYKVGTVANSCSTMHTIAQKEFELDDFSHEHLTMKGMDCLKLVIAELNHARENFFPDNDKKYWWDMIQLLPSSYNQKRTVTMNYENVAAIIFQRTRHKLGEWRDFVNVLKNLPYVKEIMK